MVRGSEDVVILIAIGILGICFPIKKYKNVRNKYNKKG